MDQSYKDIKESLSGLEGDQCAQSWIQIQNLNSCDLKKEVDRFQKSILPSRAIMESKQKENKSLKRTFSNFGVAKSQLEQLLEEQAKLKQKKTVKLSHINQNLEQNKKNEGQSSSKQETNHQSENQELSIQQNENMSKDEEQNSKCEKDSNLDSEKLDKKLLKQLYQELQNIKHSKSHYKQIENQEKLQIQEIYQRLNENGLNQQYFEVKTKFAKRILSLFDSLAGNAETIPLKQYNDLTKQIKEMKLKTNLQKQNLDRLRIFKNQFEQNYGNIREMIELQKCNDFLKKLSLVSELKKIQAKNESFLENI